MHHKIKKPNLHQHNTSSAQVTPLHKVRRQHRNAKRQDVV